MGSSSAYPQTVKNPTAFVGPFLVSVFIQAIQTGILICLHVNFWSQPSSGKITPYLVVFISLVGLYQTCTSTQQLWRVTVTNPGDWIFLTRRCWLTWGKRKSLLVSLGVLELAYIGVTLGVTIEYLTVGPSTNNTYITPSKDEFRFTLGPRFQLLSIVPVVLDTVLTSLLMIRLIQLRSSTYTRKFKKILRAVIMLTWETAVPPSACAVITVVLYGSGTESNFWFRVFRDILGKLYIMSFMITLNSRAYLSELENLDVTLQLPSLLPISVTDRTARTQPRNSSSALAESKHTEITPEQNDRPFAS